MKQQPTPSPSPPWVEAIPSRGYPTATRLPTPRYRQTRHLVIMDRFLGRKPYNSPNINKLNMDIPLGGTFFLFSLLSIIWCHILVTHWCPQYTFVHLVGERLQSEVSCLKTLLCFASCLTMFKQREQLSHTENPLQLNLRIPNGQS